MKYEEASIIWGEYRLRQEKIEFDKVNLVYFETHSISGCDTCGPETTYKASIWYRPPGTLHDRNKSITLYGLDEILRELFEISDSPPEL